MSAATTKHTNISILNLILYSDTDPIYVAMRDIQRPYLRSIPNFTYFFYCFREGQTEEVVLEDGDTLVFRGRETYIPGILEKTLLAMEYVKDWPFQYLLRSNISTAVDIEGLRLRIQTLRTRPDSPEIVYGGPIVPLLWVDRFSGITEEVLESVRGTRCARGIAILLSRRGLDLLLEKKHAIHHNLVDDVAIGVFFKTNGIRCVEMQDALVDNPPTIVGHSRFIYRHKTLDSDRQVDVECLRRTIRHLLRVQQVLNALRS